MDGTSIPLGDIERHFWLTRSVARVLGISLSEAMADGRMSAGDYAQMVTRCRAGGCHQMCEHWLACPTNARSKAPEHCANADLYNSLL